MARIAAWEFPQDATFDGQSLYAEVLPDIVGLLPTGTLELTLTTEGLYRSTLFAHGVPGRDRGAFALVLTHTGAISLTCTGKTGCPLRMKTADGFAGVGELIQVTLSWGTGGRFSVVNCDKLRQDPADPSAGHVAVLPGAAVFDFTAALPFTFGAAAAGTAPFFHGVLHRITLSDRVDPPTVTPPTATVLRFGSRGRGRVRPIRVTTPAGEVSAPEHGAAQPLPRPRKADVQAMVETEDGAVSITDLQPGDAVRTRGDGLQTVRWVGTASLDWAALRRRPDLRPVVIRKGALGDGLPLEDTLIGPHMRVLASEASAAGHEAMVSGREMARRRGVFEAETLGVRYAHVLFDRTQTIRTNGLWVEALHPADRRARITGAGRRNALLDLFPALDGLAEGGTPSDPGDPSIGGGTGKALD